MTLSRKWSVAKLRAWESLFPEELCLQSPTAALMELRRVALYPNSVGGLEILEV